MSSGFIFSLSGWCLCNNLLCVSCYKSAANDTCSLPLWLFVLLCCSEKKNLSFTALSSQHALPQDLGSGQVSLLSLCTATRLGSNSICKIIKKRNKQLKQKKTAPFRGNTAVQLPVS